MARPFQLTFLPGLGADWRMFDPQAGAFPGLVVPPWIATERGETLPHYAGRLAETIARRGDGPMVLGGVSLGGMIAYEMARHLKPDSLVLIATCRTREGLARYRPLAPLARRLPDGAMRLAKWLSPAAVRCLSGWPPEIQRLGIDMFRRADSRFMRWALPALIDWEPSEHPSLPIFQIHGRLDRAIPAARVQADQMVEDGGHLINLTHPTVVNAFIENVISRGCLPLL
ncbi:MAG TPA: alpha/beta hydrolase [Thermoguttaceae bacterium]|nr:alpha/beta hydrolase [Thermoguttaceae bacterium]